MNLYFQELTASSQKSNRKSVPFFSHCIVFFHNCHGSTAGIGIFDMPTIIKFCNVLNSAKSPELINYPRFTSVFAFYKNMATTMISP
jgi:hypothetical protein